MDTVMCFIGHWGNIFHYVKSYMCTAVEESNIETILAVMSTTELVVINTSLSALFCDFSNMFCPHLSLKTIPIEDCFVDQEVMHTSY